MHEEKILVLDFGSQYTQLIARRIRDGKVYSEIFPFNASMEKIRATIQELARKSWFVDATEIALALGSPIFTNIIMVGALAGTRLLPLSQKTYEVTIKESFPEAHLEVNLKAFGQGMGLVQ